MTERDDTPWTYEQFSSAMVEAGWEIDGFVDTGKWVHSETGAKFDAMTKSDWTERKYGKPWTWVMYAHDHMVPSEVPF